MKLATEDRQAIHRMVCLGVPLLDIADEFGIGVGDVQRIDMTVEKTRMDRKPAVQPAAPSQVAKRSSTTVFYLSSDTCKWPVGDPLEAGFRFCGEAREAGRPYCRAHLLRAYQPRNVKP